MEKTDAKIFLMRHNKQLTISFTSGLRDKKSTFQLPVENQHFVFQKLRDCFRFSSESEFTGSKNSADQLILP